MHVEPVADEVVPSTGTELDAVAAFRAREGADRHRAALRLHTTLVGIHAARIRGGARCPRCHRSRLRGPAVGSQQPGPRLTVRLIGCTGDRRKAALLTGLVADDADPFRPHPRGRSRSGTEGLRCHSAPGGNRPRRDASGRYAAVRALGCPAARRQRRV